MDDVLSTLNFYSTSNALLFGFILILSFGLSGLVRRVSMARGFVCHPTSDRWSKREVALGGGIAIQAAILCGLLTLPTTLIVSFLPPIVLMVAVGVIDDLKGLGPKLKLAFEFIAAIWIVSRGYSLPIFGIVGVLLSVFWIVALMNAVNMIDNMDGLSSGICSLIALGFFVLLQTTPLTTGAERLSLVVGASSIGFLIRNFPPAKIFMGDGGSLPLGFLIGALSTQVAAGSGEGFSNLIVVGLSVAYPLYDLLFVSTLRTLEGRPVYVGGKDHSSHRLVQLGLSDRQTVMVLYAIQVFAGATALMAVGWVGQARFALALLLAMVTIAVSYALYISTCPDVVHDT